MCHIKLSLNSFIHRVESTLEHMLSRLQIQPSAAHFLWEKAVLEFLLIEITLVNVKAMGSVIIIA